MRNPSGGKQDPEFVQERFVGATYSQECLFFPNASITSDKTIEKSPDNIVFCVPNQRRNRNLPTACIFRYTKSNLEYTAQCDAVDLEDVHPRPPLLIETDSKVKLLRKDLAQLLGYIKLILMNCKPHELMTPTTIADKEPQQETEIVIGS